MNYILHPAAEAELLESISYYESKAPGIGTRLLAEFEQAMSSVCLSPKLYQVARKPNIRRALLPTYPLFSIIFRQSESEQIQILAIAHQKRRPMYWISRVQSSFLRNKKITHWRNSTVGTREGSGFSFQ